ncbi:MAG: TrmH family RNA methyltransferase [Saprospiraceae bacterium]
MEIIKQKNRVNALLYAPQYRPNMSSMIRTAEFYGLGTIYIYDKNGLLDPPNNKTSRADMNHLARVWTAGAIEFIEVVKIDDIELFLKEYKGRTVATLLDPKAQHLSDFEFEEQDLIILGSEKEGIEQGVLPLIKKSVYIPALGNTPCLNVAVTFGIVINKAMEDLGG